MSLPNFFHSKLSHLLDTLPAIQTWSQCPSKFRTSKSMKFVAMQYFGVHNKSRPCERHRRFMFWRALHVCTVLRRFREVPKTEVPASPGSS